MPDQTSSNGGYSPDISAELVIHGQHFNVAALGTGGLVIHSAKRLEPGRGIIRMLIDGQATIYHADFPTGIDPARDRQPFLIIPTSEEAAA